MFRILFALLSLSLLLPQSLQAQDLGILDKQITIPPRSQEVSSCIVAGCSSQLCIDPDKDSGMSTCEWREEYACYTDATCERQLDGSCDWTMTDDLESCLQESEPTPAPTSDACNGICEPDDWCEPGAVCIWEGKCPSDCEGEPPTPSPIPLLKDTKTDQCIKGGGTWNEYFPNGCMDTCEYHQNRGEIACTQATSAGCDCGPHMCWTGQSCVSNPLPTQPTLSTTYNHIRNILDQLRSKFSIILSR